MGHTKEDVIVRVDSVENITEDNDVLEVTMDLTSVWVIVNARISTPNLTISRN